MDFSEVNELFDVIAFENRMWDQVARDLESHFDCDHIFIYSKRGNFCIRKSLRVIKGEELHLNLAHFETTIDVSACQSPFILDSDTTKSIGLGPIAKVFVAPISENDVIIGAVAIAKEAGADWGTSILNQFYNMMMSVNNCNQINIRLDDSQQYVNTILESINTAIFAVDHHGILVHYNKASERIFDCRADWAIGKHYSLIVCPNEKEKIERTTDYVLETGNSYTGNFIKMTLLNGRVIYLNIRICPWINRHGKIIGAIGIMTDETQNKQFQDQLVRVEKMAILGQIAAQVSHEVMSPLASIRGFARIIEKNEPEASTYKMWAKSIVEQVDKIKTVITELLDFGRPDKIKLEIMDLNEAISNAVNQKKMDYDNVNIIEEYEQGLPCIEGDPTKVDQVFVNLLQNAYQAIEMSGVIEITTFLSNENFVVATIRDNGCGIPRQHLKKIFDPYFTTKKYGTGLGLAIVQQLVKSHGGKISVESGIGSGTSFSIEFPVKRGKNYGQI